MGIEALKRMDKIALTECMEVLSYTMKVKETKCDALLYFQFEDLINEALGTSINNSDCGGIYQDGKLLFDRWHIARKEYLETKEILKS